MPNFALSLAHVCIRMVMCQASVMSTTRQFEFFSTLSAELLRLLTANAQLNLTIMNPGYNELPDITNIDLRIYTYVRIYSMVNEP